MFRWAVSEELAPASQDDEREHIRREKIAIEEMRAILAEMLEDSSLQKD